MVEGRDVVHGEDLGGRDVTEHGDLGGDREGQGGGASAGDLPNVLARWNRQGLDRDARDRG